MVLTMSNPNIGAGGDELWMLLAPPSALVLLFVGGFFVYLLQTRLAGIADKEMQSRGSSVLLGAFVRDFFVWLMSPLLRVVLASKIPANAVTTIALLLSVASGVALGLGRFSLGGWLFLGSGFLDYIDGRVARSTNNSSPSGALLDSVFDRYAEGAVFIGLAFFYRESWVLFLVLTAGLGSQLISYIRSRSGDLGVDVGRVGLLQRPERIAILGTTLCLSPILEYFYPSAGAMYLLAIIGIGFLALMTNTTAVQRLAAGMKLLNELEKNSQDIPAREETKVVATPALARASYASASSSRASETGSDDVLANISMRIGAATATRRTQPGIGKTRPIQANK